MTEDSDSDEQAPLSKVAKGIPKLHKSPNETIQSSADIDFERSTTTTKKGSVANDPIKLSGETTNDEVTFLYKILEIKTELAVEIIKGNLID